MPEPTNNGLRKWAGKQLPLQAAVELLMRCFDGQLITPDRPWVAQDVSGDWINFTKNDSRAERHDS